MNNNEDRIFSPLILSGGSHNRGSGTGCAMNVVSWMHGDEMITDFPTCSNDDLARMVQILNDSYSQKAARRRARERQMVGNTAAPFYVPEDYTLDPEDAEIVIALGSATMGTGVDTLTNTETEKGLEAARKVMAEAARKMMAEASGCYNYDLSGCYNYDLESAICDVAGAADLPVGTKEYNDTMAPLIAEAINAFKLAVAKPIVMPTRADVQVAYEKMVAAGA